MIWWHHIKEYIDRSGLENQNNFNKEKETKSFLGMFEDVFFQNTIDILYFWLGIFTYVYFFTIAFLYIGGLSSQDNISLKIIHSLAEPYLGAVAIYTILKEARKRRNNSRPRHWGEIFVILWLLLLVFASTLALLTNAYVFDKTLELIITLAISVGIIYVGGVIHKP